MNCPTLLPAFAVLVSLTVFHSQHLSAQTLQASDIVPFLALQVESAATLAYSSRAYAASLPESLSRLGIGHRVEVQYTSANFIHPADWTPGSTYLQAQDSAFSVKVGTHEPNSVLPQSILTQLSVPTGAAEQTSGSYDPGLLVVWEQTTRGGFALTENMGVTSNSCEGARTTSWLPGVSIGHALGTKLAWFAEYAPAFARGTAALHTADAGFTYSASPLTEFNVRAGYQNDQSGLRNLLSVGYFFRIEAFSQYLASLMH